MKMTEQPQGVFEEILLMLLDAKYNRYRFNTAYKTSRFNSKGGQGLIFYDTDMMEQAPQVLQMPNFPPLVIMGQDRLYSPDPELLMQHPVEILGKRAEFAMYDPEKQILEWNGFQKEKVKKPYWASPKTIIYRNSFREINVSGKETICQRYVGCNSKTGKSSNVYYQKHPIYKQPIVPLAASIIEDFYRPTAWIVKIGNQYGFKISVTADAIIDLFKIRDNPITDTGRKKPILHWVQKHIRSLPNKTVTIPTHLRGIADFDLNDIHVSITQPMK